MAVLAAVIAFTWGRTRLLGRVLGGFAGELLLSRILELFKIVPDRGDLLCQGVLGPIVLLFLNGGDLLSSVLDRNSHLS